MYGGLEVYGNMEALWDTEVYGIVVLGGSLEAFGGMELDEG